MQIFKKIRIPDTVWIIVNFLKQKKLFLTVLVAANSFALASNALLFLGLLSVFTDNERILVHFSMFSNNEFIALLLFINIIAFTFLFLIKKSIAKVMIEFELYSVSYIIKYINSKNEKFLKPEKQNLLLRIIKDCRFGGRLIGEICLVLNPLLMLIVSLVILLYLDYLIVLVILILALILFYIQKKIFKYGNNIMDDMETNASEDKKIRVSILDGDSNLLDLRNSSFLSSYSKRLVIPHVSNFIIGIILILFISWFYFFYIPNNNIIVNELVIYFYICILIFGSMKLLFKSITNMGLFYRYFRRLSDPLSDEAELNENEHLDIQ
jgi:hypothetical protein